MKEKIVQSQLTEALASSTLNRRSIMAELGKTEQPPIKSQTRSERFLDTANPPPDSLGGLLAARDSQAAREVARVMYEMAQKDGRKLTPEQEQFILDTGFRPPIGGGADVPENEGWMPENTNDSFLGEISDGRRRTERDPEEDYYDENEARQRAQREAEALQLKRDFKIRHGNAIRQEINDFATEIKTKGFNIERYKQIAERIQSLRKQDIKFSHIGELALREEVRELGMALARVASNAPDPRSPDDINASDRTIETVLQIEDIDQRFDQLENIISGYPINEGEYLVLINRLIKKVIEQGRREDREFVLEYAAERFFALADKDPQRPFPRLNFVAQQNLDGVLDLARRYTEEMEKELGLHGETIPKQEDFFGYLSEVVSRREIIHELYRQMTDPEKFKGGVADFLRKEGLKFVEDSIVGVSLVRRHFERAYASQLSFKGKNWLDSADFEKADEEVRMTLKAQDEINVLRKPMHYGEKSSRRMRKWEIDRAFSMGRAMMALSQRQTVYTVLGEVPDDPDEFLKSVDKELIARTLATLKLIPQRFFDQPSAKVYLSRYLERLKSKNTYGLNGGGVYGKSAEAMAILDTGISDIQSNSWRSHWLFLDQKEYATERQGNDRVSFREYYRHMRHQAMEETGIYHPHGEKQKEIVNKRFNTLIRSAIRNQRLFLGTILRYGDLDIENKSEIWKTAAKLLPSRIAAIMPHETMKIVAQKLGIPNSNKEEVQRQWNKIKIKLWQLEDFRVEKDAQDLKNGFQIRQDKGLYEYNDKGNGEPVEPVVVFSKEEKAVVDEIIQYGLNNAAHLAKVKFIFTAFLDDVPRTAWDNLGGQDVGRILNDQASINEGLGAAIGVIANPAQKPEKIIEAFSKTFHGFSSPLGVSIGQQKMEPFIVAWLQMARMNNVGKYFDIGDFTRLPRSELEKFNLQSKIALNEQEMHDFFIGLAQHEIISDDLAEKNSNGLTQFQELEKEFNVEAKDRFWGVIRMLLILFPPALVIQFIKNIFQLK